MTSRKLLVASLALSLLALGITLAAPAAGQAEGDLIASHLRSLSVAAPAAVGSLLVFPVHSPSVFPDGTRIEPAGKALASGALTIREMPDGMNQQFVMASYDGDGTVFGQYGGGYGGGGQGRGGGGSFFMASLSTAALPVVCFEEGRMGGDSPYFDPSTYTLAHPALRGLSATGDQEAVWREIRRQYDLLGPSPIPIDLGPAYSAIGRSQPVLGAWQFLHRMAPTIAMQANGVIVACGDQILGIDYYGDPKLFAECRQDVLKSYALVNAEVGNHRPCRVTDRAISQFLMDLMVAPRSPQEPVQLGERVRIAFGSHVGEAAALDGRLVYLGAHDTRPPLPH